MIRLLVILSLFLTVLTQANHVFAQGGYSIKEMTPAVESALNSRRDRYAALEKFKADGAIGETNRGYVKALKEDTQAEALARAESADRKTIYNTIAEQNNLAGQIETIEKVFAQVQREKAADGVMVQNDAGAWEAK